MSEDTKKSYDNNNSGALYKNDKKTSSDQPAMRGFMELSGVKYWASAWKKKSKATGKPYMSIALQAQFVGTLEEYGSEEALEEAKNAHRPDSIFAELHPVDKVKSEKAPVMEGVIKMSEDEELAIVAWFRTMSGNKTFMSIKVDTQEGAGNDDEDDDSDCFFGFGNDADEGEDSAEEDMEGVEDEEDEDVPF